MIKLLKLSIAVTLFFGNLAGCTSYIDPTSESDEEFVESLRIGVSFASFVSRTDSYAVDPTSPHSDWPVQKSEVSAACEVEKACTPNNIPGILTYGLDADGVEVVTNRVLSIPRFIGTWGTRETWLFFDTSDSLIGWTKVRW